MPHLAFTCISFASLDFPYLCIPKQNTLKPLFVSCPFLYLLTFAAFSLPSFTCIFLCPFFFIQLRLIESVVFSYISLITLLSPRVSSLSIPLYLLFSSLTSLFHTCLYSPPPLPSFPNKTDYGNCVFIFYLLTCSSLLPFPCFPSLVLSSVFFALIFFLSNPLLPQHGIRFDSAIQYFKTQHMAEFLIMSPPI